MRYFFLLINLYFSINSNILYAGKVCFQPHKNEPLSKIVAKVLGRATYGKAGNVRAVTEFNKLRNPHLITPDQIICIPQPLLSSPSEDGLKNEIACHQVQKGQNLSKIIAEHQDRAFYGDGGNVTQTQKLNALPDPNRVYPGDYLCLLEPNRQISSTSSVQTWEVASRKSWQLSFSNDVRMNTFSQKGRSNDQLTYAFTNIESITPKVNLSYQLEQDSAWWTSYQLQKFRLANNVNKDNFTNTFFHQIQAGVRLSSWYLSVGAQQTPITDSSTLPFKYDIPWNLFAEVSFRWDVWEQLLGSQDELQLYFTSSLHGSPLSNRYAQYSQTFSSAYFSTQVSYQLIRKSSWGMKLITDYHYGFDFQKIAGKFPDKNTFFFQREMAYWSLGPEFFVHF